jgi:hypothetical protein
MRVMKALSITCCLVLASALLAAEPLQRRGATKAAPKAATKAARTSTDATCAADLGTGITSGRRFCDVVIADSADKSIMMKVPPRRGAAKLLFDLHTRVAIPPDSLPAAQTFSSNTAIVVVLGPKGEMARAIATGEFRRAADLFDRIAGGPGGGPKIVGPGPATPVEVTLPTGTNVIGIVGERLEATTRLGSQTYDTPGRPVAIVSNLRVEYTPLR